MYYHYYESSSTDPAFNLALEDYLFQKIPRGESLFMLWQNDNAVIVGKYQNSAAEIDHAYVKENGIKVVRRLSGGGAVCHDLGNLNFTFICDADSSAIDFTIFCEPVVRALKALGVNAEINGRNDICIDDQKISGNAQYARKGRVMHHGTLLFDSDLTKIASALKVSEDKYSSKATRSVRSRVTNIKPFMKDPITIMQFMAAIKKEILSEYDVKEIRLTQEDLAAIRHLQQEKYDTWEWNFGASPAYDVVKKTRIDDCGTLELHMNVQKGIITEAKLFGDFFGNGDIDELMAVITGRELEQNAISSALLQVPVSLYCKNLTAEQFAEFILS